MNPIHEHPSPSTVFALHTEKLDQLLQSQARLEESVQRLHNAMFVGNGSPPMTTRVAKLEQAVGGIAWLAGTALTAAIGLLISKLFKSSP